LAPTFTAFAVTALLEEHFPDLVDTTFTAKMESSLDEISSGNLEWLPYLETFYKGKNGLEVKVQKTEGDIDGKAYRQVDFEDLPCVVRIGSNGPWLEGTKIDESGNEIQAKGNLPMDITPGDLDIKQVDQILSGPSDLGTDPKTGEKVFLRFGPYGPYVQLGNNDQDKAKPRRASLPKELKTDDLTLDEALVLLSLPRLLGVHPEGGVVEADRGRFGPYIKWIKNESESENRSLKKEDDVFTVDIKRALEILAMPKMGRGGQEVLKDFGKPKEFKEKIQILNGRYGVYLKCGKTNVSIAKDTDIEKFTIDDAVSLLEEKLKDKKGSILKKTKISNKKTTRKKKS
jgi:DNA topoisomerase-1